MLSPVVKVITEKSFLLMLAMPELLMTEAISPMPSVMPDDEITRKEVPLESDRNNRKFPFVSVGD